DDPARGGRGGRAAGEGLRHQGRHLVLPELQRAGAGWVGRGTLEPAEPGEGTAQGLRDLAAGGPPGPGDRRDRLHPHVPGADPGVRADAVYGAGDGWVWTVGYPGEPAEVLRGEPQLHWAGGCGGVGGGGEADGQGRGEGQREVRDRREEAEPPH